MIQKIYEDFDKCERIYYKKQEAKNEKEYYKQKKTYELSCVQELEDIPKEMPIQVSFRNITKFIKLNEMKIDVTPPGPFAGLKRGRRIRKKKALIESKIVLNKQTCFQLACLSCYITQQMKATKEYCALLKQIDHLYIDAFIAFFEETPSNYQEKLEKIDEIAEKLSHDDLYNDEMKAHIIALQTGAYGQKGDITFLKNSFKYLLKRLPQTENVVEIRGLQDTAISVIWWSLHSGNEANIDEMVTFIEPNILKYSVFLHIYWRRYPNIFRLGILA